jgi:serine/threonine-protein kinase
MAPHGEEQSELPEGTRLLERYTILDLVGGGGMASIYRATDERLDRVVCVKLLRLEVKAGGSGAGAVYQATYAHFLREALALSKLQHPNTLRIYDFGYLGQRPFQISEYLDGGDLQMHLRARGALSPAQTLGVLERMAGALAEAHERGIIHRDIKPSNILFGRVGAYLMPKLADFGIAQSNLKRATPLDVAHDASVSTVALFSPRWAAPEQLVVGEEGPFTDVYALALVTAYMLSGKIPFDAVEVRSTFPDRVRNDDLVSDRLSALGIPGEIKRVLLGSLSTQPERRVASPLTFFDELRAVLRAEPVQLPLSFSRSMSGKSGLGAALAPPAAPLASPPAPPTLATASAVAPTSRAIRAVEVHEKLDLTLGAPSGAEVRFRVSIVPHRGARGFQISVKGLNCFVTRASASSGSSNGGAPSALTSASRPTPAINADEDGSVDFVSMSREWLGRLVWSFGNATASGHVFRVSSGDLVVRSSEVGMAVALVALDLAPDREVLVMCKR